VHPRLRRQPLGSFQDADESGYYEYICKRAGIAVHYCAEQFENDGSPTSNIIKSVKRSMAGEYSRELSTKVFQGACRLIQLGFKQGGAAGYGLRRMLIDQSGQPKGMLGRGEHKSLQTDRVVLTLGPGRRSRHRPLGLPRVPRRAADRTRNRGARLNARKESGPISAGRGPAARCISSSPTKNTSATTSITGPPSN
jgi:hypothetical protein